MSSSEWDGVPPMIAQGQIVDEIAREVVAGAPTDWQRLQFQASILAPTTEYFLFVEKPDGSRQKVFSSPRAKELSRELRTVMQMPGRGSWFSFDLVIDSTLAVTTRFNYEEEPRFSPPGIDPIAYVADQEKFPRDEDKQPEWLKAKLAEGRAALAARGK